MFFGTSTLCGTSRSRWLTFPRWRNVLVLVFIRTVIILFVVPSTIYPYTCSIFAVSSAAPRMRPLLFAVSLTTLYRQSITTSVCGVRAIGYSQNSTCSPLQPFSTIMSNSGAGNNMAEGEVAKESLACNGGISEEKRLPPLSAADFKVYNGMAEHMDYFVSVYHHKNV